MRVEESVTLAGEEIAPATLVAALERCAATGKPATAFEALTAAALLAMSETPADIAVVEAGLGGAKDATNATPPPRLAVLTPIDIDHAEFLGDTVDQIAADKAGIIKNGTVAVVGPQPPEAMATIVAHTAQVGAELRAFGDAWAAAPTDSGFSYTGPRWTFLELPRPGMAGAHQVVNAALAIAALEALVEFDVGEPAIRAALTGTRLPGRLQRIEHGPLFERLPAGWSLWLDGGHNGGAGQALAEWAGTAGQGTLVLIAGMLASKDARAFLAPLAPLADRLLAVPVSGPRPGMAPEDLAATARSLGLDAEPAEGVRAAIDAALGTRSGPACVLICGSLYLAGAVLSEMERARPARPPVVR